MIEFSDNGVGIEAEHVDAIFDRLFSTRQPHEGAGLGLSISRRTLLELDGQLSVESAPGGGSNFRAVLPWVAAPPNTDQAKEADTDDPLPRSAHILAIDDEPEICNVVKRVLERHEVTTASDGMEAATKVREDSFDLVLCDMMMPNADGIDVYEVYRAAKNGGRFVVMTGGVFTPPPREVVNRTGLPVVNKPVKSKELRRAVSDCAQWNRLSIPEREHPYSKEVHPWPAGQSTFSSSQHTQPTASTRPGEPWRTM